MCDVSLRMVPIVSVRRRVCISGINLAVLTLSPMRMIEYEAI